MKKGRWYMAGTEQTGNYVVVARTARGRLGIRMLGDSTTRIRLEPRRDENVIDKMATQLSGWKRPGVGGQHRFSVVVMNGSTREELKRGLGALGIDKGLVTEVNDEAPAWSREVVKDLMPAT